MFSSRKLSEEPECWLSLNVYDSYYSYSESALGVKRLQRMAIFSIHSLILFVYLAHF